MISVLGQMNLLPELEYSNDKREERKIVNMPHQADHRSVDHLILHDSTGNHIDPNLFSGKGQSTKKIWAPYIDMATTQLNNGIMVSKSITVLIGVRHLRQYIYKKLSMSQYRERVEHFVETAKSIHPTAQIVLCSILADGDPNMIEGAVRMNSILIEIADGAKVIYADTQSKMSPDAMDGVHPRKTHIRHLVSCIKQHLRPTRQMVAKTITKTKDIEVIKSHRPVPCGNKFNRSSHTWLTRHCQHNRRKTQIAN